MDIFVPSVATTDFVPTMGVKHASKKALQATKKPGFGAPKTNKVHEKFLQTPTKKPGLIARNVSILSRLVFQMSLLVLFAPFARGEFYVLRRNARCVLKKVLPTTKKPNVGTSRKIKRLQEKFLLGPIKSFGLTAAIASILLRWRPDV
ncbi:hypothetical protein D1R32_gp319 [Tunisvirus fontaine2]|uniref:Uncharacterized protein n=1 Tax=Tunisvirus fontaine2 TaxID=1421067 RepID=V9SFD0_9VIRU|nr:hypothetical protein D1R32_gp319 [Tunisvirus fontaine2]AHC55036.1 hypothetical protein TNS_ORF318 [Tunisvirus fontaine2]